MNNEYYCLVAGLAEYSYADKRGKIDIEAIRTEISEVLSAQDKKALELLYLYYDIENIVNILNNSKLPFNVLGNLTREQVADEISAFETDDEPFESLLPPPLRLTLDRYLGRYVAEDDEPNFDKSLLEKSLHADYFLLCSTIKCDFLRKWCEYDRIIRNIIAVRRAAQLDIEPIMVGELEDEREFEYYSELISVLETRDFVERETKMDMLRLTIAEGFSEHNYFDINMLLAYLVKLNILFRWSSLDKKVGEERFRAIVKGFTDSAQINI